MTSAPLFSLLDQPWIPVVDLQGRPGLVSLRELFRRAHELQAIEAELPTVTFALHRFVLAVLYRVAAPRKQEPSGVWEEWWRAEKLPITDIETYLERFRDRFDLFGEVEPLYQVAGLRTSKGEVSGLEKLIPDVPNGEPFFTVRAAGGIDSISFDEAVRYLIHAQAFDPSGIKSGAEGDPRVKGGKGYPIGTAWVGALGGILLLGSTLKETLLLNLVLEDPARPGQWWSGVDDLAAWERPALTAQEEHPGEKVGEIPGRRPTGPAQLLTQQSRRVRLERNDDRVTGVLIANGDQLWPQNRHHAEPMTGWRHSEPQSKKHGMPVLMPREHELQRSLWRGLGSLLPFNERAYVRSGGETGRPAAVLDWMRTLRADEVLDPNRLIRTRAIGMAYGSQSSVVDDVYDDSIVLHAALLDSARLQHLALEAVGHADAGVRAVGDLARDLAVAAGGDGAGQRDRARESGYARLDQPYRTWLFELTLESDADASRLSWADSVRTVLRAQADELLRAVGPAAWRGRKDNRGNHVDVGVAERRFAYALHEALPRRVSTDDHKTGEMVQ
jgi:CRISPR system Cascade subunit CasA